MARQRIVKPRQARTMTVDLPPAGDERREVLRERADNLAEAAETEGPEGGAMRPDALRVENELAQHFNELEVTGQDRMYVYRWVQSGFYGRFIKAALAHKWEVVQGDDPEAIELKGMAADTTRRLGDVILMRRRKDIHKLYERREALVRRAAEEGVTTEMIELAEKFAGEHAAARGMKVHVSQDQMNPEWLKRMATRATAVQKAKAMTDKWIREGRMPGAGVAA